MASNLSDEEKSQTFRKRRLSLSRHNIAPDSDASASQQSATAAAAAAAAAVAAASEEDLQDEPPLPEVKLAPRIGDKAEHPSAEPSEAEQKAQTFRKRRLSLTLKSHHQGDAKDQDADTPDSQQHNKVQYPPQKRRASDASGTSANSLNSNEALRVRTLHAGEILAQHLHPPSPAIYYGSAANTANGEPHILYRMSRPNSLAMLPTAGEGDHTTSPQPKWKKHITRKHDEDERKLPFPRDVVGTYSCHGVEPVYDSDYEHDEDDDDDEDDWTEDISGAKQEKSSNPFASNTIPKEPKPTTAAKINQDRGGVAFPYGKCARSALFAAYDGTFTLFILSPACLLLDETELTNHILFIISAGHGQGGELVSQFALHEIQFRLEKQPEFPTDLEKAFIKTFLAVDEALQHEPLIEPLYAGTTACVALLRENILTVANSGDSRAVIARRTDRVDSGDDTGTEPAPCYKAIDLTVDQNPDLPEERSRIEGMGGFVSPPPEPGLSARVWLDEGFTQIGLAMARSIGDHAVAQVGVIAEPVVTTHTVENMDEFLIIATDGVWEFISSEEAVKIVGANLPRGATKATQALIEAAAARWHDEEGDYRDDITALVVRLQELWKDRTASSCLPKT